MNIDIVNRIVSKNTNISKEKVELVNKFYWDAVKNHIYSYNPSPLNIRGICVIFPNKYLLKKNILELIHNLRSLRKGEKYSKLNSSKEKYEENICNEIRKLLSIRKYHKYTN